MEKILGELVAGGWVMTSEDADFYKLGIMPLGIRKDVNGIKQLAVDVRATQISSGRHHSEVPGVRIAAGDTSCWDLLNIPGEN